MNESTLGRRLRDAREATGQTAKGFAELIGSDPYTISRYENDHRKAPADVIAKYAEKTGVSMFFLTTGRQPPPPPAPAQPTEAA